MKAVPLTRQESTENLGAFLRGTLHHPSFFFVTLSPRARRQLLLPGNWALPLRGVSHADRKAAQNAVRHKGGGNFRRPAFAALLTY